MDTASNFNPITDTAMRLSYRKKLFFYFLIVFAVFAAIVVFVQQNRERTFRNDEFKRGMDVYATLISKYIAENHLTAPDSMSRLDSLLPLLPRDLRISIIDRRGNVLFDNGSDGKPIVENHLSRPEIAQALIRGGGSHIRHSATTGKTYYYYARLFGNDFVRVALPYDNAAKLSLKADDFFLYFMLLLFFVALISLLYLSDRFGKAVSGLRDFLVSTENNHPDFDKVRFPDTELGEIGNRIVTNYRLLRESRNLLDTEREKLIRHFHYSDEGICIFSPDGDKIYANSQQKEALAFLDKHFFHAPDWLFEDRLTDVARMNKVRVMRMLYGMMCKQLVGSFLKMSEQEQMPECTYSLRECMDDLYGMVFAEALNGKPVNPCRRELQRMYAVNLKGAMGRDFVDNPAVTSLIFEQLERMRKDARKAAEKSRDWLTKAYWEKLSEF